MSANVRKVTLAITKDEYEWAERTATRTGVSISSVLSAAAREKRTAEERDARQRTAWAEVVDLVLAGSPLTEDELAAAKAELDGLMIPRIEPPSAKKVARERLDALRALGCAVAGDDGVNLPAGGPRGGLSRPISHYGLVFEKPAREALGLSHVEFRALVLPAAWVKNPESATGPRVGVYDPRTLLAIRRALDSNPKSLEQQRDFVVRRRQEIDAEVREEHAAFLQRAHDGGPKRAKRRRG